MRSLWRRIVAYWNEPDEMTAYVIRYDPPTNDLSIQIGEVYLDRADMIFPRVQHCPSCAAALKQAGAKEDA